MSRAKLSQNTVSVQAAAQANFMAFTGGFSTATTTQTMESIY
jgi:hypothetical protein